MKKDMKQNHNKYKSLMRNIVEVAVHGLKNMYNFEDRLFCEKVKRTDQGVLKEGLSYRYTIISTLGLHKYEIEGGISPISVQDTLSSLIEKAYQIDSIGDVGLLLWLCALASPQQLSQLNKYLEIDCSLLRYGDARKGLTTELAWFLAGLSHASSAVDKIPMEWKNMAMETYNSLLKNYSGKGIFSHMNRNSIVGTMRCRIGCFADQVYTIYALSIFAKTFNDEYALKIALDCAKTICHLQGPLGQWWWHYDSSTGSRIGRYPVYSTHQNGMAPMALFTLGDLTGMDFSQPIYKGLEWINKYNELEFDFVDATRNVIWRSIYKSKYRMYSEEMLSLLRIKVDKENGESLKKNWECRPYHLGWILYSFSNKHSV